ncbi:hypothetical protein BUALT_Bualt19G0005600 [Buddleja alternifolia]|uniref:Late embryogenesis abundant protein LEA-2 subgroup domain-containing protein n=1 Tax=Buddleja alternifolia TaxID=168488 RepID=A0AAV6W1Q9_9LAMI|nr:hypothetical protein BUALT_Bualt19G0005600 [Buddleja alternifolia]
MYQPPPPPSLQKPPGYKEPDVPIQLPPPPQRKAAATSSPFLRHKTRRGICCRTFCCCFCIVTSIILLLLISATAFFYLRFHPRLPEVHLKSITFTKFNVTAAREGHVLDSQSTIVVEIKNPNKILRIEYDRTHILLNSANGGPNLGQQTVPGFTQGKNNVTTLKFAMKAQKQVIDNKSAQILLKNGFKYLVVDAEVRSGIGMKGNGWVTGKVPVKVVCGGVRLDRVQGGGAGPKCSIKIFNWYVTDS